MVLARPNTLPRIAESASASALEEMTRDEVAAREVRITNQRIRSSGFPYVKGLADFDWDFQPSVPRAEIDELGYLDVGSAGEDLLFRLISTRCEQRSTIITADVGIGGWGRMFGDDVAASAIADRVCRHCHLVKITGRSYRLKDLPRDGPVRP
ncbi:MULTISPECIES: ATP-binding protein [unclassified Collinsella]|uniref:ATP-binding protein n=1 Tax=unclassified Collinsella TaxID=2637548 RepID=UPI001F03B51B|nr:MULTISPECIES: ATP-binding protein [unclassified Collinsella]